MSAWSRALKSGIGPVRVFLLRDKYVSSVRPLKSGIGPVRPTPSRIFRISASSAPELYVGQLGQLAQPLGEITGVGVCVEV